MVIFSFSLHYSQIKSPRICAKNNSNEIYELLLSKGAKPQQFEAEIKSKGNYEIINPQPHYLSQYSGAKFFMNNEAKEIKCCYFTVVVSFHDEERELDIPDNALISDLKEEIKKIFNINKDNSCLQLTHDDDILDDDDLIEDIEIEDGDTIVCYLRKIFLSVVYNSKIFKKSIQLHNPN